MSQNGVFDWGGSNEVKSGFYITIDPGVLEVCEWSERVTDRCIGLERDPGARIWALD